MFIFRTSVNETSEPTKLETLMLRIADGDKDAFAELYSTTKSSVYGFALSILKNAHDAEDVMQSCYIKIWSNASSYRPDGKPMAWVLTITKNLSFMKLREGQRTTELSEKAEEFTRALDNTEQTVENKLIIEIAMKELTDEERRIVMLHAVSGLKFREISELLEIGLSTVLSKYNRAIKKMKKLLESHNEQ